MFECEQCQARKPEPRAYSLHLGAYPRCPRCGTYRLSRLAKRDKIDKMEKGPINFAQFLWGAELYHCRFCRLQFYDVRKPVAPELKDKAAAAAAPISAGAQGSQAGQF
jgi:hypothetical protein